MRNLFLLLTVLLTLTTQAQRKGKLPTYNPPAAPDYSQQKYWNALPYVKDEADHIPGTETWVNDSLKQVDVFYVYPTLYMTGKNWNADVNNKKLNKNLDTKPVRYQASVFNASCRVYSPRYRQAHIRAFYAKPEQSKQAFDLAYSDVKRAFEYYLAHYNNGRPFIIASHSQGTYHARRLLRECIDTTDLRKQMVAAYVIGFNFFDTMYVNLKPCEQPGQTGCYITWASYNWNYKPADNGLGLFGNICVNPLSWTRDTIAVDRSKGIGGMLLSFNKEYPHASDVQIKDGHLKVRTTIPIIRSMTNMHIADYNLFWYDIRANVKKRVDQYLSEHALGERK